MRAPVAGIAAKRRERDRAERAQFLSGSLNQQPDLPVAGVIAEGDRFSVRRTQAALRAEEEKLFAAQFAGVPAHAGVLREAKHVATRTIEQHLFGQRQTARGSAGFGQDAVYVRRGRVRRVALVHQPIEPASPSGTKQELGLRFGGSGVQPLGGN